MTEPGDAPADHIDTDLGVLAGITDRGFGHERNEDAMALGQAPNGTMAAVVCDGVSTSYAPEQASRAAADAALDVLLTSNGEAEARVDAAVAAAASAVAALAQDGRRSPSCTLVCALVQRFPDEPAEITVGWVGDSRAYWLAPAGAARQLTTDHSWAAQMVAAGVLDEGAAMRDPRAHAITRWLGANGSPEPEIATLHPPGPGVLLLCTDGLWNYLPDPADLADVALPALAHSGPIGAADALTRVALDAGGRDNITVVVIPA
jgi:serine/threonine protein phosphatase PrpC